MSTVSWVVLSIICTVGGLLFGVAVGLFLANPAREREHYRQAHQHAHPTPRAIAALRRAPRGVFRAAMILWIAVFVGSGQPLRAEGRLPAWAAAALVSGQAADAISTCNALGTGKAAESNPLLPGKCAGISTVKGAVVGVMLWSGVRLAKKQPKSAAVMLAIVGGIGWAAMAYNVSVIKKLK